MSYGVAKKCFRENIELTGGPKGDAVNFNLYNGLFQLADQLEQDVQALQHQVRRIEESVQMLRR